MGDSFDEPRSGEVPGHKGNASTVTIVLPYSISNIVFIERVLLWVNLPSAIAENGIVAVCIILGLLVGNSLLWTPALRGHKAAIIAVYALYVPLAVAGVAGLIIGSLALVAFVSDVARGRIEGVLGLIIAGASLIMGVLLLCNIFEKGLWAYVRLNGRCPVCKTWRFGRIKRPQTVTCGHCNSTLDFIRSEG